MQLSVVAIMIFALIAVGLIAFLSFYYAKANRRDREKLEAELNHQTGDWERMDRHTGKR